MIPRFCTMLAKTNLRLGIVKLPTLSTLGKLVDFYMRNTAIEEVSNVVFRSAYYKI